jgi:peroxiredoxin
MTTPQNAFRRNLLKTLIPLASILVIILGALLLLRQSGSEQHELGDGHDHGTGIVQVGEPFPAIRMNRLDGSQVSLKEFKGRLLVLNLWATWCEACMVEMPSLQSLAAAYKDQGLEVWALSLDEEYKTEVAPVVKKLNLQLPIFVDEEQKISEILSVEVIPVTYIISGSDLKLLSIEEGERDWMSADIRKSIETHLKGPETSAAAPSDHP